MADIDTAGTKKVNLMRLEFGRRHAENQILSYEIRMAELDEEKIRLSSEIEKQKDIISDYDTKIEECRKSSLR